jgi:hypothetical protein
MKQGTPGSPAFRKGLKKILPSGYRLAVQANSSHFCVTDEEGTPLRLPDGRKLTVPNTPRVAERSLRDLEKSLRCLGVRS